MKNLRVDVQVRGEDPARRERRPERSTELDVSIMQWERRDRIRVVPDQKDHAPRLVNRHGGRGNVSRNYTWAVQSTVVLATVFIQCQAGAVTFFLSPVHCYPA